MEYPRYRTKIEQRTWPHKLMVMETILDLDEAIDQLCEVLPDHGDPFAEDLCPYYGVLWPAAEGLAQLVAERASELKGKSLFEVGCGLAYPSLVARSLGLDVRASDFHDDVPNFLARNLRHNSLELPYEKLNWREAPGHERYDVVMGSDVLYEPKHPGDVARSFCALLKEGGEVWLSDPGRAYLQKFVDEMTAAGFQHEMRPVGVGEYQIFVFRFWR